MKQVNGSFEQRRNQIFAGKIASCTLSVNNTFGDCVNATQDTENQELLILNISINLIRVFPFVMNVISIVFHLRGSRRNEFIHVCDIHEHYRHDFPDTRLFCVHD